MAITGKEICRCYDQYGPISVYDDGNKRTLTFGDNHGQSCQLKLNPHHLTYDYTRAMLLALLLTERANNLLLFGLGGASLVNCLHRLLPDLEITVVELRQKVIDVAYSHFQMPRSKRLHIINSDAADFLQQASRGSKSETRPLFYDVIFCDIYDDNGIVNLQLEQWFIDECAQLLSDTGWLVMNCWDEHRGDSSLVDYLKTCFRDVRMLTTQSGNWVLFAGKLENNETVKNLQKRAKQLSATAGFSLMTPLAKLRRCQ